MEKEKTIIYNIEIEPEDMLNRELPLTLVDVDGNDVVFNDALLAQYKNKANILINNEIANQVMNKRLVLKKEFEYDIQTHIFKKYSQVKQASDTNDKEYWGAWLISHFPDIYTSDNIYSKMFGSASKIIEGASTIAYEVEALKEVTTFADADEEAKYPIALEQLLKVAVRQGWVQACKAEYSIKIAQVEATTTEELEAIQLNLPSYPL